jgi:hypothetical protein
MIRFRRKQKPAEQIVTRSDGNQVDQVIDREPATSPPPTLKLAAWVGQRKLEAIKTEFYMTIQPKVTNLSSREASMLLMVCNVFGLQDGIDTTLYLSMEFLFNYLTRSGSLEIDKISDERVRQTCLLTHLILSSFRGEWTDMGQRIRVTDQQVIDAVIDSNWLPDRRTFNSWKQHWDPERWLSVRIVPVEYLLDRSKFSEPYSGYCKGYGEGTSRGAQSTPYDSELDGEEYTEPLPPEFNLLEVEAYVKIHTAIEAQRAKRIQGE